MISEMPAEEFFRRISDHNDSTFYYFTDELRTMGELEINEKEGYQSIVEDIPPANLFVPEVFI